MKGEEAMHYLLIAVIVFRYTYNLLWNHLLIAVIVLFR